MSAEMPVPDTTPPDQTAPIPPAPAPATTAGVSRAAVLVVVIALLVGALAGGALANATGLRVLPAAIGRAVAPAARTGDADAAIIETVRRANDAQVQAFSSGDPSAMRATATVQHYDEMVRINDDLRNSGVTSIQLVSVRFGAVTVNGSNAQVATTETWRATLADGTTDESTDRNDYTLVLQNGTWLVDNDVQPDSASSGTGGTTPPGSRPIPQGQGIGARDTSSNWSGYAATGGTFTSVSGTWIVPQPSGTTSGVDATWVGIGGMTSTDLIQAGTQTMVSGRGGAQYEAWIELLPRSSQPVPLSVSPGDTVTVSITQQGDGRWLIAMRNDTTGRTYSTTVTYASSTSSAEWIQEAPSAGRRVIPLDDFGTLQFTKGSAVKDGKSASIRDAGGRAITMIDRTGRALARPSALGPDGASFTVTRA
ncbi:MAG: hypothetical protein E6I40_09470 [Chloroflexi bacterium]|nr:MAG: hypothetical protein E6I40_09470 [Chloroflexota bacterium]